MVTQVNPLPQCPTEPLSLHLDHELVGDKQAALEHHLAGCTGCRQTLVRMSRLQQQLAHRRTTLLPPATLPARILSTLDKAPTATRLGGFSWRWALVPATALGVALIGWVAVRAAAPADIQLVATVLGGLPSGGEHPLEVGTDLHTGERFAVEVEVDRPAHVYVLQRTEQGTITIVAATEQAAPARPGGRQRLPAGGSWFQLDSRVGTEQLMIVASAEPLSESGVRKWALAGAQPPTEPKELRRGGGAVRLQAQSTKTGVAVLGFSFRHLP